MSKETLEEWKHNGRDCQIVLQDDKYYLGYTKTFLNISKELINRMLFSVRDLNYGPDKEGWIGFSFNRPDDACCENDGKRLPNVNIDGSDVGTWWTLDDVRSQIESLADRIEQVERFVRAYERSK